MSQEPPPTRDHLARISPGPDPEGSPRRRRPTVADLLRLNRHATLSEATLDLVDEVVAERSRDRAGNRIS